MRASSVFAVAFAAAAIAGCSGDEKKACSDDTPPSSFDPSSPAVSFSKDVMPIFATSCAFSSCHGSLSGDTNGVYLGSGDPAKLYAGIVGVRSGELPTMAFVEPNDPGKSFLMRKMDGSQCAFDAQCTGGTCEESMPKGEDLLPVETRDVVRRWIAQGAKDD